MTREQSDYLLMLVRPLIEKQNTDFRKSIPALHRLALTLSYLATGENFNSLRYLFRIPQSTISTIIPYGLWTSNLRRREAQRIGKKLLINTMTSGIVRIVLVRSTANME